MIRDIPSSSLPMGPRSELELPFRGKFIDRRRRQMEPADFRGSGDGRAICVSHVTRRNAGEVIMIQWSFLAVLLITLAFAGCARPHVPGVAGKTTRLTPADLSSIRGANYRGAAATNTTDYWLHYRAPTLCTTKDVL